MSLCGYLYIEAVAHDDERHQVLWGSPRARVNSEPPSMGAETRLGPLQEHFTFLWPVSYDIGSNCLDPIHILLVILLGTAVLEAKRGGIVHALQAQKHLAMHIRPGTCYAYPVENQLFLRFTFIFTFGSTHTGRKEALDHLGLELALVGTGN